MRRPPSPIPSSAADRTPSRESPSRATPSATPVGGRGQRTVARPVRGRRRCSDGRGRGGLCDGGAGPAGQSAEYRLRYQTAPAQRQKVT